MLRLFTWRRYFSYIQLDRLGRTTKQLIELSQWLDENGIDFHIIDMNVSTKDAMGKMFFTMMSAFAELEANLLSERTKKGLEAVRARGRKGGRPSLPDHKKREIKFLYDELDRLHLIGQLL